MGGQKSCELVMEGNIHQRLELEYVPGLHARPREQPGAPEQREAIFDAAIDGVAGVEQLAVAQPDHDVSRYLCSHRAQKNQIPALQLRFIPELVTEQHRIERLNVGGVKRLVGRDQQIDPEFLFEEQRGQTAPLTLLWLTPMRALANDTAHNLSLFDNLQPIRRNLLTDQRTIQSPLVRSLAASQ